MENSNYADDQGLDHFLINQNQDQFILPSLGMKFKLSSIDQEKFLSYIKPRLKIKNDLNAIVIEDQDYIQLLKKKLGKEFFKLFPKCFIYIHEKGSESCEVIELTKSNIFTSTDDIHVFNALFPTVKKSKKLKNEGKFNLNRTLNLVGTYLAEEYTKDDFRFIFIFARESLLPYTADDLTYKDRALVTLVPYIELYFRTKQYSSFESLLNLIETHLPEISSGTTDHSVHFHRERVELIGSLFNTLKHELSNPLFGVLLSLEILKLNTSLEPELLSEMKNSLQKCLNILNDFSDLFNKPEGISKVNLSKLIQEVFTLAKSQLKGIQKSIIIEGHSGDDVFLETNAVAIFHILFNLIVNSSEALDGCQKPHIKLVVTMDENNVRSLRISDNGHGIPSHLQNQIFKPFFTTKGQGTGLGLSISKKLSEVIGCKLTLERSDVNGTVFCLEVK